MLPGGRGAAALLLLLCVFGCSATRDRADNDARRRWRETGARLEGRLLLVDAPVERAADRPIPDTSSIETHHGSDIAQSTLEEARAFTVAIRARRAPETRSSLCSGFVVRAESGFEKPLSSGSGIVIDRNGLILTNDHVVGGSDDLDVLTPSAGWIPARMVAADPASDLAVLAVDAMFTTVAELDAGLNTAAGQPVAAVGYTPDASGGVSMSGLSGRLRALRRSLQGDLDPAQRRFYACLMESTVPIPRGYSGGPLIDAYGNVIGINTAGAEDQGTGRRMGYAIPMTTQVRRIVHRLAQGLTCEHGHLGMWIETPQQDCGGRAGASPEPVIVARTVARGPADQAGIVPGDIIQTFDHTAISSASQFAEMIHYTPAGRTITLGIRRGHKLTSVCATLAQRRY